MKNPKPSNPMISDVARLADVSRTTVSLVIKGNPEIPAETKERVMAAISELGYRPNLAAQSVSTQRSGTFGFVSDEIVTTPYAGKIFEGAQDTAWNICLDKAYDYETIDQLVASLGYIGHIKRRGQDDRPGIGEPIYPPRRWKVERTISWINNMLKLRTRWEKKSENYQALVMLAAALLLYRMIVLG